MIDHYIELTIVSDPEFSTPTLMSALISKFHRSKGKFNLGLSFPKYHLCLGDLLRIHGNQQDLHGFMTSGWLKGIRDHLEIGEIKASPKVERHVSFTRVAPKSKAQMIKRAIKKGMPKERIEKIEKMEHLHLKLPFANLQSLSNGNKYRVFIMRSDYMTQPMSGDFDSYGLSRSTTVPWF